MLGYQLFLKGLIICQTLLYIMVTVSSCFPTIHKRFVSVHSKETQNWTGENTQGKTCLNFCPYVNCNNGTCYQDARNCGLSCICENGFWGHRCQFEIRTTTLTPTTPHQKSKSDSDIVRISLGNIEGGTEENIKNTSSLNVSQVSESDQNEIQANVKAIENFDKNNTKHNETATDSSEVEQNAENTQQDSKVGKEDRKLINMNKTNTITFLTKANSMSNNPSIQNASSITKAEGKVFNTMSSVKENGLRLAPGAAMPHKDQIGEGSPSFGTTRSELDLSVLEPFTSEYLDVCERNCTSDNVCIPVKDRFHCFPKKYRCPLGFPCENGICVKNDTQYKCVCEPGWIGDMCDRNCSLNCNGGTCYRRSGGSDGSVVCLCKLGYKGKRCEQRKEIIPEEDEDWYWYVLIPCICCVIVLIIVLVIILYCMQKRKWLFAMKIIHFFKEYEDDDGKEYDAFISYKSSKEDEDFVLHQLYPKLEEEMGFKLCMHFRDFTPGDIIANNIIHAIENSRRTIMVLSPNYVESEWCRMEYQKAQHEMLKRKHRIIPLMFRDITKSDQCDKALSDILSTVTYLQWPEDGDSQKIDRFWNQLRLSLPKKRVLSSSSSTSSGSVSTVATDIYSSSSSISPPVPSSVNPSDIVDSTSSKSDTILNITKNESSILNSEYPSYTTPDEHKPTAEANVDSSLSNVTPSTVEIQTENSSSRLRKIVKDVLKLKIHSRSDSFVRLQREGSIETPTTPSPNVSLDKDVSPLIAKRKSKKSSTWSAKSLQQTLRPCARSMSEKDCYIKKLDILPQSSVGKRELPDVCKHLAKEHVNGGFENEKNSERIGRIKNVPKQNTQVLNVVSDHQMESSKKFNKNVEIFLNNSVVAPLPTCDTCAYPSVNVDNLSNKSALIPCNTCIQNVETSNLSSVENGTEQSKQMCKSFRNDLSRKNRKSSIPRRHSDGVKFNLQLAKNNIVQVPVNITESSIFNSDYPSYVTTNQEISDHSCCDSCISNGTENLQDNNTCNVSKVSNDWPHKPFVVEHGSNRQTIFNSDLNSANASYHQNVGTNGNFEKNSQNETFDTSGLPNNANARFNVLPEETYHRNCETCILSNDSDTNCNNNPCYSIYIHPSYILPVQRETSKVLNTATDCLIPRGPSGGGVTSVNRRSSVPNSPIIGKPLKERKKKLPRRVSAPHLPNVVLETKSKEQTIEGDPTNSVPVPPVRRKRKRRTTRTKQV